MPGDARNPFQLLLNLAHKTHDEELKRAGSMLQKREPQSQWGPRFRTREKELQSLVSDAIRVAHQTGYSPVTVEARVRELAKSILAILLWQRDAPQLTVKQRKDMEASGIVHDPACEYFSAHHRRMVDAYDNVEPLAIRMRQAIRFFEERGNWTDEQFERLLEGPVGFEFSEEDGATKEAAVNFEKSQGAANLIAALMRFTSSQTVENGKALHDAAKDYREVHLEHDFQPDLTIVDFCKEIEGETAPAHRLDGTPETPSVDSTKLVDWSRRINQFQEELSHRKRVEHSLEYQRIERSIARHGLPSSPDGLKAECERLRCRLHDHKEEIILVSLGDKIVDWLWKSMRLQGGVVPEYPDLGKCLVVQAGADLFGDKQRKKAVLRAIDVVVEWCQERLKLQTNAPPKRDDLKLSQTEREILTFCRKQSHKAESIRRHLGLSSSEHMRRVLARLVSEGRLKKDDEGYRTTRTIRRRVARTTAM